MGGEQRVPDAAARPECTCRERHHLEGELEKSRLLVRQLDESNERLGAALHASERAVAALAGVLREDVDGFARAQIDVHKLTNEGALIQWPLTPAGSDAVRRRDAFARLIADKLRVWMESSGPAAAEWERRVRREALEEAARLVDADVWAQHETATRIRALAAPAPSTSSPTDSQP